MNPTRSAHCVQCVSEGPRRELPVDLGGQGVGSTVRDPFSGVSSVGPKTHEPSTLSFRQPSANRPLRFRDQDDPGSGRVSTGLPG